VGRWWVNDRELENEVVHIIIDVYIRKYMSVEEDGASWRILKRLPG
jgi:hypothetical protein